MDTDEREWVERARTGDARAERALYDLHVERIFRLAYRLSGETMTAEDWTQEAFVRAFDRIGSFRGEAAFGTWLRSVALSVMRNRLKRRGRERELMVSSDDDATQRVEARPGSDAVLRMRMNRAIDELSETLRPVFVLHELEGLRLEEIAELFDAPIGTIKARLSRAREKLRDALADLCTPVRELR